MQISAPPRELSHKPAPDSWRLVQRHYLAAKSCSLSLSLSRELSFARHVPYGQTSPTDKVSAGGLAPERCPNVDQVIWKPVERDLFPRESTCGQGNKWLHCLTLSEASARPKGKCLSPFTRRPR